MGNTLSQVESYNLCMVTLVAAIAVMLLAVRVFFKNKKMILNFAPRGFGGSRLFWGYSGLIFFFLFVYVIQFLQCVVRNQGNVLISFLLFFGALFVLLTMIFVEKLFDSILFVRMNQRDTLTGLLNKGAFQTSAESRIKMEQSCVFVICDIDDFKILNDTLGHLKGDEVIVRTSRIISKYIKDTDISGRFGGDEFCVFMPNTDIKEAESIIETVRNKLSDYYLDNCENCVSGISVGVSYKRRGDAAGYDELFLAADAALYKSKRHGKNQMTIGELGETKVDLDDDYD